MSLEIVFTANAAAVVVIDDFQVRLNSGYVSGDYGPGKALMEPYIESVVLSHKLQFYPAALASFEEGTRSGGIVLAKADIHRENLSSLSLLRLAP